MSQTKPRERYFGQGAFESAFPAAEGQVEDLSPPIVCKSGEFFVATRGRFVATLGSCIAVVLRDRRLGSAGINHYLLPERSAASSDTSLGPAHFGEDSIRALLRKMKEEGSQRGDLEAWLVGGANQIPQQEVGTLNLRVAERMLSEFGIPVRDRSVGGNHGRRLEFRIDGGTLTVWVLDPQSPSEPKTWSSEAPNRRPDGSPAALLRRFATKPPHLIAIGSSTGGVEVVKNLLMNLGPELPPVLVVQHMPAVFTAEYAKRLDGLTGLHVREAVRGEPLRRGHVYLAPGGKQMGVKAARTSLCIDITDDPAVDLFKPSVNYLYRSLVAAGLGGQTLAVLLTGMGSDGAAGLMELRRQNAATVTQSAGTCLVYGMPRAADEIGASMASLTPDQINQIFQRIARR